MIYLASPYFSTDEDLMDRRYRLVCARCHEYAISGFQVFSPIAHWHPIAKQYGLPRDHEFWQSYNHSMISFCHELWVIKLPGWSVSRGVADEIREAKRLEKEVTYVT